MNEWEQVPMYEYFVGDVTVNAVIDDGLVSAIFLDEYLELVLRLEEEGLVNLLFDFDPVKIKLNYDTLTNMYWDLIREGIYFEPPVYSLNFERDDEEESDEVDEPENGEEGEDIEPGEGEEIPVEEVPEEPVPEIPEEEIEEEEEVIKEFGSQSIQNLLTYLHTLVFGLGNTWADNYVKENDVETFTIQNYSSSAEFYLSDLWLNK